MPDGKAIVYIALPRGCLSAPQRIDDAAPGARQNSSHTGHGVAVGPSLRQRRRGYLHPAGGFSAAATIWRFVAGPRPP